MPEETTRHIGDRGEDLASRFLISKGWSILERNYYAGHAEVDIIAKDGEVYVFVEVKMRSDLKYGHPIEFVTEEKVRLVFGAAERWMREHKLTDKAMRFDVIGIVKMKNKFPEITHYADAYR